MITCAALASFLTIYSTPEDCWGMQVNLAARNQYLFPKTGLESDITLHRGGLIIGGTKGKYLLVYFWGPFKQETNKDTLGLVRNQLYTDYKWQTFVWNLQIQ